MSDRVIMLIVGGLYFFAGLLTGAVLVEQRCKKQAIEHGVAQYNTITGDWEWKANKGAGK